MGREQSLSSRDFIKAEDGQLEVAAAKTGEPEDDDGHHVDAGGRGGKSEDFHLGGEKEGREKKQKAKSKAAL